MFDKACLIAAIFNLIGALFWQYVKEDTLKANNRLLWAILLVVLVLI